MAYVSTHQGISFSYRRPPLVTPGPFLKVHNIHWSRRYRVQFSTSSSSGARSLEGNYMNIHKIALMHFWCITLLLFKPLEDYIHINMHLNCSIYAVNIKLIFQQSKIILFSSLYIWLRFEIQRYMFYSFVCYQIAVIVIMFISCGCKILYDS